MAKSGNAQGELGLSVENELKALDPPGDVEPMSTADVNLRSLHRALRRTRAILYTAMTDGTIKKTLWANTREDLLAYLDRVIEVALDIEDAEVASVCTRSGRHRCQFWIWSRHPASGVSATSPRSSRGSSFSCSSLACNRGQLR